MLNVISAKTVHPIDSKPLTFTDERAKEEHYTKKLHEVAEHIRIAKS